jgi:hypothetical protein
MAEGPMAAAQLRSTTPAGAASAFEVSPVNQPVSALGRILSPAAAAAAAVSSSNGTSSISIPRLPIAWHAPAYKKGYCFKSPAWAAAGFVPVLLKEPFRQVSGGLPVTVEQQQHLALLVSSAGWLCSAALLAVFSVDAQH